MELIKNPHQASWENLLKRPSLLQSDLAPKVMAVLEEVKKEGDIALKKFTQQFDQVVIDDLAVSEEEIEEAVDLLDVDLKEAITLAKNNIEGFHRTQKEHFKKVETMPGVVCWRRSVPITKVGFYIPGGTAPLFSTILMLGVPAGLAGCKDVIMCTPPNKSGKIHPAILFTAQLVGVKHIFKVGGAQAIAAMAYGTESIPAVYKIFGPGNQYVTMAKSLVSPIQVAIDFPAGPSEVAVVADKYANPEFIAADLLSQAEHGVDSQVLLVSTNEELIHQVQDAILSQLSSLARKDIAAESLKNSKAILLSDREEMAALINAYGPEHLILSMNEAEAFSEHIINAGSIFLGHFSPESVGDYASGTNHTLPTNGYAKMYSGVSLDSFLKKITVQHVSEQGLRLIGPAVQLMARAEGLEAHKKSVEIRLESLQNTQQLSSTPDRV